MLDQIIFRTGISITLILHITAVLINLRVHICIHGFYINNYVVQLYSTLMPKTGLNLLEKFLNVR